MALTWNWKDKVGTVKAICTMGDGELKECKFNLYNGNAYLISIDEFTENGVDKYNMSWFFVDKTHMNNMLGLSKGMSNCLNSRDFKITELSLDSKKCRNLWDIVKAFVKAFDNITINFYTTKEETT